MSMLPRRGKCALCGHDWDQTDEGWRSAGNIAGFAGREIRDLQKRIGQFQFCLDRVAEALGNVCCGGVDSSPEDQMADPHSTTRVLVDAIEKLKQQVKDAQDHVSAVDEQNFLSTFKNRDGL